MRCKIDALMYAAAVYSDLVELQTQAASHFRWLFDAFAVADILDRTGNQACEMIRLAYDGTTDSERGIRDQIVEALLESLEIERECSDKGRLCSLIRHVDRAIGALPDLGRDLSLSRLAPNIACMPCTDCSSDGEVVRSRLRRPCIEQSCSTDDGTTHSDHSCSGEKNAYGMICDTCGAYGVVYVCGVYKDWH